MIQHLRHCLEVISPPNLTVTFQIILPRYSNYLAGSGCAQQLAFAGNLYNVWCNHRETIDLLKPLNLGEDAV